MKLQIGALLALFAFVGMAQAQTQVSVGKVGRKSFYILESSTSTSGEDAVKACAKKGLRLAALENPRENDLVSDFLVKRAPKADVVHVWLGGRYKRPEGKWYWVGPKNTPVTYNNWDGGSVDAAEYNNCMYMVPTGDNTKAKWKATYCDIGLGLPLCQSV